MKSLLETAAEVFALDNDEISATVAAMNTRIRGKYLRLVAWRHCSQCRAAKRLAIAHAGEGVKGCHCCTDRIKRGVSGYAGLCHSHRERFDIDRTCAYHREMLLPDYSEYRSPALWVPIQPISAENDIRASHGLKSRRGRRAGVRGRVQTHDQQVEAIRQQDQERDARYKTQQALERAANITRYTEQVEATGEIDFAHAVYSRDMVISDLPLTRAVD